MKFKHFLGECDSKEWIGPELVCERTGEKYHLVISLLNMEGLTGEDKYVVSVSSLLLSTVENKIEEISESFGLTGKDSHEYRLGAAWEYGYKANLWSDSGQNPLELMKYAVERAKDIAQWFDCYMSETLNGLGWTGWKYAGKTFDD